MVVACLIVVLVEWCCLTGFVLVICLLETNKIHYHRTTVRHSSKSNHKLSFINPTKYKVQHIHHNNKQQTTINKQQTTNNKQQTTTSKQQTNNTSNKQQQQQSRRKKTKEERKKKKKGRRRRQ